MSLEVCIIFDTKLSKNRVFSYINYCVDSIVPFKEIRLYPNNKPWVTREIKEAIDKKKLAFKSKNRQQLLSAEKDLKYTIKK